MANRSAMGVFESDRGREGGVRSSRDESKGDLSSTVVLEWLDEEGDEAGSLNGEASVGPSSESSFVEPSPVLLSFCNVLRIRPLALRRNVIDALRPIPGRRRLPVDFEVGMGSGGTSPRAAWYDAIASSGVSIEFRFAIGMCEWEATTAAAGFGSGRGFDEESEKGDFVASPETSCRREEVTDRWEEWARR